MDRLSEIDLLKLQLADAKCALVQAYAKIATLEFKAQISATREANGLDPEDQLDLKTGEIIRKLAAVPQAS